MYCRIGTMRARMLSAMNGILKHRPRHKSRSASPPPPTSMTLQKQCPWSNTLTAPADEATSEERPHGPTAYGERGTPPEPPPPPPPPASLPPAPPPARSAVLAPAAAAAPPGEERENRLAGENADARRWVSDDDVDIPPLARAGADAATSPPRYRESACTEPEQGRCATERSRACSVSHTRSVELASSETTRRRSAKGWEGGL